MRSLGRGLALLLVVGAVLSAVTGDGFARVMGAIAGYADFGYAPEQCGNPSTFARAINGDKVRVCQDVYSTEYGFYAGHERYGIDLAEADLYLSLPDQGVVYNCCNDSTPFGPATFDPIVPGAGTMHADGGTHVRVAQTARPTATGYTITYAITNLTAATLHIRPAASMTGYGYDTPVWAKTEAPYSVTLRQPDAGGAITLAESSIDGSPAATSYSAGALSRLEAAITPAAAALDKQLWNDPASSPYDSMMALAWPTAPLAAHATASYSIAVTLVQNRELQVKLAGAAPVVGTPTQLAATVVDDRLVARGLVHWDLFRGRQELTGTGILDGTGRATLSVPMGAGGWQFDAYYDVNRDGSWQENEPFTGGTLFAPA